MSDQAIQYPVYRRPHFDAYTGHRRAASPEPCYIYPDAAFAAHDIFDVCMLDGGAFLCSAEHLGGAKGADFLTAFQSGRLFGPWMSGETVDWSKATQVLLNENHLVEYYCWLNRLYYLLPLAQQYFLTRDEDWARQWLRHFDAWSRHGDASVCSIWENRKDVWIAAARDHLKRCLNHRLVHTVRRYLNPRRVQRRLGWSDMQLSWRLLVFIHSVFLLKGSDSLDAQRWHSLYRAIEEHARYVHCEAATEMKLSTGRGNHFLHKGVALVYVGTLYPELAESGEYLELGRRIVSRHSQEETSQDGANVENSPSYSHFIARLHLEAALLLEANHHPPIPGLLDTIQRQYFFLRQSETPSGLTLPINDSYHLDALKDQAIVDRLLLTLRREPQKSCFFAHSSLAVLRHSRFTLFVDGADANLVHHHLGKPNIILYSGRFPVLVDAGCCNYDRKTHKSWYINRDAHNIVRVEPLAGRCADELKGASEVKVFRFDDGASVKSVSMSREIRAGPVRYQWERRVSIGSTGLDIVDHVCAHKSVRITVLFHFAPASTIETGVNGELHIENLHWGLTMRQKLSYAYTTAQRMCAIFSEANREEMAPEVQTKTEGRDIHIVTSMQFQ